MTILDKFIAWLFSRPETKINQTYLSWPNQDWATYAEEQVIVYGLDKLDPKDARSFCPNGMSVRNWVHLLAAMCKHESGFKPELEYRENFKNGAGEITISTGLFQLSYHTQSSVYGFKDATTEKLKDPYYNIRCAVHILHRWVKQDGVIASVAPWRGGSRYWAVLRTPKVDTQVKKTLKPWCE